MSICVEAMMMMISEQVVRLDAKFAVQWMSKCYNLASVWQVSSDNLRRHQICELYSNGHDRLAEEVNIYNLLTLWHNSP